MRVPPVDFRDDRVGIGEARLAVEQFGKEDEAFFPGGGVQVSREACPLGAFRFPDPFPFRERARNVARRAGRGDGTRGIPACPGTGPSLAVGNRLLRDPDPGSRFRLAGGLPFR